MRESGAGGRRRDIDILRAIAVLAVILFHFDVQALSGGFLGVDMFFVISGYLITLHLRQQASEGSFSFVNFYARRIRRLFPALAVTLLATSVLALLILPRALLSEYALSVVAASTYLSNVYFWSIADYFDTESIYKPLLHTWSLSVEEQFYIFWPLFVLVFLRRYLMVAVAAAGILSVSAALFLKLDANTVFYHFPFRVHEFALGALMTGIPVHRLPRWTRSVIVALALAGIGYGLLTTTEHSAFPGWGSAAVVIGTALVIGACHPALNAPGQLTQPIVRIGLSSYSAYLVHWPMVVFYKILNPGELQLTEILLLTFAALYIGDLMYQWVEQPAGGIALPKFRLPVIAFAPAMIVLALGFYVAHPQMRSLLSPGSPVVVASLVDAPPPTVQYVLDNIPGRRTELDEADRQIALRTTGTAPAGRKHIAVLGDSHAHDLSLALRLAIGDDKAHINLIHSLCDPLTAASIPISLAELYASHPQAETRETGRCEAYHADLISTLKRAAPDIIVFGEAWRHETLPFLSETIRQIQAELPAKILIAGRVPQLQGKPDVLFRNAGSFEEINQMAWSRRYNIFDDFDARLRAIAGETGTEFVSRTEAVCPDLVCEIIIGHQLGYADAQHWTVAGMDHYGRRLVETPVFQRLLRD